MSRHCADNNRAALIRLSAFAFLAISLTFGLALLQSDVQAVSQKSEGVKTSGTGAISGTITDAATSAPLANVDMFIFNSSGEFVTGTLTDSSGNYINEQGLQTGTYYVLSGAPNYFDELYDKCAALEYEDPLAINQAVQKWLSTNPKIDKPVQLPEQRGDLTICHIQIARDAEERVREWARDVWGAWSEHHDLARQLINEATAEPRHC